MKEQKNIVTFSYKVCANERANIKHQKAICIWLTGISGSGKSTIACQLDLLLYQFGRHTTVLDGDNVRNRLCSDLGFTNSDRSENIRRTAEVAYLMQQSGLIVIVALISPFRIDRQFARSLFGIDEFYEIHLDPPLSVCQSRDPKGLYKKVSQGDLKNFTSIDSPYELPLKPELRLDTSLVDVDQCVQEIVKVCKIGSIPAC
jgi:adenylyl-sulfate kinase